MLATVTNHARKNKYQHFDSGKEKKYKKNKKKKIWTEKKKKNQDLKTSSLFTAMTFFLNLFFSLQIRYL